MISKKFDVFANQNGSLLIGEKIVLKSLLIEKAKVTRSKSFFLVLHNPVCLNILPSVYIMKEKRTVI